MSSVLLLAYFLVLFVGLAVLGWLVWQMLQQQGRLLQRLETLETSLVGGDMVAQAAPGQEPRAELPIGTPAPTFRLAGLQGEVLTLEALRATGKPVLLLFLDPGWDPCVALWPEVGRWQRDYAGKLTLAVISCGTPEANRGMVREHRITQVLLQQNREVAAAYQVSGTPNAVLVRPEGTIGSPLAQGADAIRGLVAATAGLPGLNGELLTLETFLQKKKVFGIGLSMTGTTSLTAALKLLGYRPVHFPSDEVTQLEFYRFFATASEFIHLSVLKDHDAMTDSPTCCLYQALDQSYPGSKFVLTVREKQAWLRSYKSLQGWFVPLRDAPSDSSAAHYFHFILERLYGTQKYEPETLSRAYDTYTASVIEYFRERPQDLLILDICGGEGWSKLAPFLGAAIPEASFPWQNRLRNTQDDGKSDTGDVTHR